MASLIIANGAISAGMDVTLFFTFWGTSLLRRPDAPPMEKNVIEKMFGMMLPKGPKGLTLSKMHMAGMGTMMMNHVMKQKNVTPFAELLKMAMAGGVKMVACTMTMDIMGLKHEDVSLLVSKHLTEKPTTLARLDVEIRVRKKLSSLETKKLITAARACPVHKSLHSNVDITIDVVTSL